MTREIQPIEPVADRADASPPPVLTTVSGRSSPTS